jgi:phosphatidylglycerophosphate synthase|tara:strand:+ start:325 stop:699 length:375 start_codon:yes stop_codon:yes gene_type:complete
VIDKIFKVGVLIKIYNSIKPKILGLAILLSAIFMVNYFHSEYISWAEISGKKIFLGYSYIIKNLLIIIAIIVYFYLNRKRLNAVNNSENNDLDDKQKLTFEKLKDKDKLKTEYERILDGTDEKD